MTDFVEMFRHWNAGRSQVQIHEAVNNDRKTIRPRSWGEPVAGVGQFTPDRIALLITQMVGQLGSQTPLPVPL